MNSSHELLSGTAAAGKKGKLIVVEGIDGSGKTVQTNLLVKRLSDEGFQVRLTDFPQYGKSFFADMIERYLKGEFSWPQELRNHLKKYPLPDKENSTSGLPSNETTITGMHTEDAGPKPDEVNPYLSSLLYAGDRWEMKDRMISWLDVGNIIISNRYVCSNMAHQGAKINNINERNRFFRWLEELEYKKYAIPAPDLVVYLHIPIEISQELIKTRISDEQGLKSTVDMHEKDVDYLKRVQNTYMDLAGKDSCWSTIDCFKNNKMLPKEEIAEKVWNIVKNVIGKFSKS